MHTNTQAHVHTHIYKRANTYTHIYPHVHTQHVLMQMHTGTNTYAHACALLPLLVRARAHTFLGTYVPFLIFPPYTSLARPLSHST